MGEIERAVETVRAEGNDQIVLLHCISIYPPDYETIHLRNMETLQRAFDCPVGFSDHTLGTAIPLAAIALGACIIEKHFTLDQDMEGWDHAISANPEQMRTIVREGKNIVTALGSGRRSVSDLRWRNARSSGVVWWRDKRSAKVTSSAKATSMRSGLGRELRLTRFNTLSGVPLRVTWQKIRCCAGVICCDTQADSVQSLILVGSGGHARVLLSTLLLLGGVS